MYVTLYVISSLLVFKGYIFHLLKIDYHVIFVGKVVGGGVSTAGGLVAQYIDLINYLKTHVTFLKTDSYFDKKKTGPFLLNPQITPSTFSYCNLRTSFNPVLTIRLR